MQHFSLINKTIIILSPERWGTMRLSKHHYALELARKGNTIYFIEPPYLNRKGITISGIDETPGVKIVRYKPVYRGKRFLPRFLYNLLLWLQVKLLLRRIGEMPDIVWSFDPARITNLHFFGKRPVKIFHAVDFFDKGKLPEIMYTADIIISCMPALVKQLRELNMNAHLVHHGLSRAFSDNIGKAMPVSKNEHLNGNENRRLQVGFSGNLLIEALDRTTMIRVINNHPDIDFIFWGNFDFNNQNLGAYRTDEVVEFIQYLQKQPNVVLKGAVTPHVLSNAFSGVDIFWICWNTRRNPVWSSDTSPHKIMEYLSTGKPVIAHYISVYEGSGLLYMLPDRDNAGYGELFAGVVAKAKRGEEVFSEAKIIYAMNNTYAKQVERIEAIINDYSALHRI